MNRRSKAGSGKAKTPRRKPSASKAAGRRGLPNVGLETETARVTRELDEAREQLTATSEMLKVISSSSGELEPVFEAILENATRICQARFANLNLYDGNFFRRVAIHNPTPQFAMMLGEVIRPHPESGFGIVARTKQIAHIDDVRTRRPYLEGDEANVKFVDRSGARTVLAVPMLKNDELLGLIAIFRQEVRPFTDRQIELVKNFAAQAVIAIENARLLNELRELLQQQTATADVLKVISSSPGELEPVFGALLENATRICEARFGNMSLYNGETFQNVALHNPPAGYTERGLGEVIRPHAESGLAYVAKTKQIAHIDDIRTQPPYREGDPAVVGLADVAGARTLLIVPMLKENTLVGTIAIYRQEVRLFTDKQIELVRNFAAQAVIAIENARLLNELREALQQQTATSEVLRVISSSPGELVPVFDTMLANATRICEAKIGVLYLRDGDDLRAVAATHDAPPAYVEARKQKGWDKNLPLDGPVRRAATTKQIAHMTDISELQSYLDGHPLTVASVELGKFRTALGVPMLKDDELIGVITINRQEVRPFTDKQIELVKNFASQAVIAIENTRLLNELRQRTDDLTESLEQQTATSEVLRIISSSPGDLEPVFEAMLQNSVRICEAGFGQMFLCEGDNVRLVAAVGVPTVLVEFDKQRGTFQPSPGGGLDGVMRTKQVVHIADLLSEHASYPPTRLGGARSYIAVPMLKENKLVGAIAIYRQEVRPFTDKQIDLVKNFAAQAVIAIENTRLLNELRQRTLI